MTTKNNESCQNPKCGEPLAGGYVEIHMENGEYRKVCFSCAIAELKLSALDERELEEEE